MYPKVPAPLIQNAILHDSELVHQVYIPNVVLTKSLISLSVFKMTAFNITPPPKIYIHHLSPFRSIQPFKPIQLLYQLMHIYKIYTLKH